MVGAAEQMKSFGTRWGRDGGMIVLMGIETDMFRLI